MNEHLIITQLENNLLRITAEAGYKLYNDDAQRFFSNAVTDSTKGWRAVLDGSSPEPHERTLAEAKAEKIAELVRYDASEAVNSFTIGNVTTWISKEDRPNLRNTCLAYQEKGDEAVNFMGMDIPIATALSILSQLDIYAAECYKQTKVHEASINAKRTIATVDNYDFTTGYPEKLQF